MTSPLSQKTILLLIGDIVVLYGSLIVALFIRYDVTWQDALGIHLGPFSFVFALWLIVFYNFNRII